MRMHWYGVLEYGNNNFKYMKINLTEKNKSTGIVTVKRYKKGTIYKARKLLAKYSPDKAYLMIQNLFEKNFIGVGAQNNNIIVSGTNTGRNLIAQQLGDYLNIGVNTTYPLRISYGEMGTGSTTPANSDTQLTTPSDRTPIALSTVSGNVVTSQFFWADAELANATYYEFGTFTGGSATLSSGQLFNHALFSPSYTKASGEDTTVEVEFTIN